MTPKTLNNTAPHAELYSSVTTGKMIAIACDCAIGHDHEYADWIALADDKRRPISNAA